MKTTTIPIKEKSILSHEIDDQAVLVLPLTGKVKVLNQVGAFIWDKIDGQTSLAELIEAVANIFDVERPMAEQDVVSFLKDLQQKEMIELR